MPMPATLTDRRTRGTLPYGVRLSGRSHALCVSATLAAAALMVAGTAAVAPQDAARQNTTRRDSFDDLYARGQRANAAITTLTAHFTETTSSSLLTRPLVSRGVLAVQRPARVVLRYSDPESRVVLIDGDRMTVSWPSHQVRQTTEIGAAQRRVQKYFVNGTAAELRSQFDIEEHDISDRPGTYHVTMVPKRKQIREALARLDLWVMRSTLLLDAIRMTFANGDTKMMAFDEVMPNVALEAGTFTTDR
jgi:outer membrane lipoprotein-sorting protein